MKYILFVFDKGWRLKIYIEQTTELKYFQHFIPTLKFTFLKLEMIFTRNVYHLFFIKASQLLFYEFLTSYWNEQFSLITAFKLTFFQTYVVSWIPASIVFQRKTKSSTKQFFWMLSIKIIVWIYIIWFYHWFGCETFFTLLIVFIVELSKALHWSLFP